MYGILSVMDSASYWVHWFPVHMVWHVLVAGSLGWWVAQRTGHASLGWACAAISLLVDLDHVADYLRYYGWQHVSWRDFVNGSYMRESGRVYIFGHAWEWVVVLLIGARLPMPARQRAAAFALAIGLAGHLAVDTIDHREYIGKNILMYRLAHGFAASAIITPATQRAVWGEVRWPPTPVSRATSRRVRSPSSLPLTTVPTADR